MNSSPSSTLSNNIILTIRLIRSFPYRNIKPVVMRQVDLNMKTKDFIEQILNHIQNTSGLKPHRTKKYDTLKIHHKAHSFKTQNLVINFENDSELILNPEKTLLECGIEHETELSFFEREEYEAFKKDPTQKW
eukprot:gb/GECH01005080.1/.p1 GENE.gb/GECH01005080.1/~~gb/GECH01005080.1/.p1  ORF type:complete len:133 (+),score=35.18 gb/GECH01005080.1/:1-399(+)